MIIIDFHQMKIYKKAQIKKKKCPQQDEKTQPQKQMAESLSLSTKNDIKRVSSSEA